MAHKCSGSFLPWGVVVESKIVVKNVIAKTQKCYFTYSFEFLPMAGMANRHHKTKETSAMK
jgi:hypothetical protein